MTIFPKMKATPEYIRRKISKKENQKLTVANKLILDNQIEQQKNAEKLLKEDYNKQHDRLKQLEEQKKKLDADFQRRIN